MGFQNKWLVGSRLMFAVIDHSHSLDIEPNPLVWVANDSECLCS